MAKPKIGFPLLFCVWGVFSPVHAQQREVKLSLEECIVSAVENNLDVAVQVFDPQIMEATVTRAAEKFLPQLLLGYTLQSEESASYSFLDAEETLLTDYNDWSIRLYQEVPTGGQVYVNLSAYKNESNASFQTINPRYGATLSFRFDQPLLKNFGFKTSRREIIIAQNNLDVSESRFKDALLTTIYQVEEAYWNLVFNMENLKVMQQSLELARDLEYKNKKEVDVGMLAPIEVIAAEAEVAIREADILQAEVMVSNSEDSLKTLINRYSEAESPMILIQPADEPQYEKREISLDQALKTALLHRPDLQANRYDLQNRELDLSYAKNQLLPDLSLSATYWSPGISGTQLQYLNNDPLTGVVVGTIQGGGTDSLKDAINFKYRNWNVGLTLSIPTNTLFTRAQHAQAQLALEQALTRIENQEKQIFLEVRNAVRLVEADFKRVAAYKVARELAEQRLEVEEKKLNVGLSTNYIVLQQQRDLANARSAELRALIDYNLSLAALDRAMGITLEKKNIKVNR